jgi:hypothetical protein
MPRAFNAQGTSATDGRRPTWRFQDNPRPLTHRETF